MLARNKISILAIFSLVLVFLLTLVASAYNYGDYYSNYNVYTFHSSYPSAPSYEETKYEKVSYNAYTGYSKTTQYTQNVKDYGYSSNYNYDVYVSPGYYKSGQYIKVQYSQPRVFIEQRENSCDLYGSNCQGAQSNWGAKPVYDYRNYGPDNYPNSYYYQPRYDSQGNYYNWKF